MSKLSNKHLVCVEWLDAWGREAGEFTEAEIISDLHHPAPIRTFGLLVHENENGVMIAQEITTPEDTGEATFRGLGFIPSGMIQNIIDLGPPKAKKPRKVISIKPTKPYLCTCENGPDPECVEHTKTQQFLKKQPASFEVPLDPEKIDS